MEIELGEGHARWRRTPFIVVPSALAALGMGAAMLQGAVGATLSSANGFTLQSNSITSSSLKIRPGAARVAGGDQATIYAETGDSTIASQVAVTATVDTGLPLIGKVSINMRSTDPTIALGAVVLNAKQLTVSDAKPRVNGTDGTNSAAALSNVDLGIAESEAGFAHTTDRVGRASGYVPNGFSISAHHSTINNVDATAYAIHLAGLSLDNLSLSVSN